MKTNEQPFFARFLEGQDFPEVKTNVKAGSATTKFPSDLDEAVTNKWPSDGDDFPPDIDKQDLSTGQKNQFAILIMKTVGADRHRVSLRTASTFHNGLPA